MKEENVMGWITRCACHFKNGKVDRLQEIYDIWENQNEGRTHVLKLSLVGKVVYGAIQVVETGMTWGLVALTDVKGDDFSYKDMDESCGPNRYDCPVSILKLLSPTTNENALEWRKKCYDRAMERKMDAKLKKKLEKLPIGTMIEFESEVELHSKNPLHIYTIHKGDTIRLIKRFNRFNKTVWQDAKNTPAPVWKTKWISKNYYVIDE